MSAQSNIVINDGAPTPVARTFNPKGAKTQPNGKDVATWRDQTASSALGFLTITEQHAAPNANGIEKFRWVIEMPTTEVPYGATAPQVAYNTVGVIEVWLPQRASDQELKHIAAFIKNFAATTYLNDAVVKREAAW